MNLVNYLDHVTAIGWFLQVEIDFIHHYTDKADILYAIWENFALKLEEVVKKSRINDSVGKELQKYINNQISHGIKSFFCLKFAVLGRDA